MNAFLREGLCVGGLFEGVLIRGVTQVLRKRWAYLRGGPIRGEII